MGNVFCCQDYADGLDGESNLRRTLEPLLTGLQGGNGLRRKRSFVNIDGNFDDRYIMKDQLGKGSTAHCHACVEKSSEQWFAVKIINKKKMSVLYSDLLPQFRKEVDILGILEHPNIIKLKEVFETKQSIHVVTELARGGELFEFLVNQPNSIMTEAMASFLIRQCISAVAHMHQHGVIHRDIKLENILLASPAPSCQAGQEVDYQHIQLKMIDFGLAKSFHDGSMDSKNGAGSKLRTARTFFGTVGYIAPEMMKRKSYTQAVDVWALGVVTFVLLCGVFPFDDNGKRAVQNIDYRVRYPKWVKSLSTSARELVSKLLQVDHTKRITAASALEHPWVSGRTASPRLLLSSPSHLRELRSPPFVPSAIGVTAASTHDSMILSNGREEDNIISPLLLDDAAEAKSSSGSFLALPTKQGAGCKDDLDTDNASIHSSSSSSLGSPSLSSFSSMRPQRK